MPEVAVRNAGQIGRRTREFVQFAATRAVQNEIPASLTGGLCAAVDGAVAL